MQRNIILKVLGFLTIFSARRTDKVNILKAQEYLNTASMIVYVRIVSTHFFREFLSN